MELGLQGVMTRFVALCHVSRCLIGFQFYMERCRLLAPHFHDHSWRPFRALGDATRRPHCMALHNTRTNKTECVITNLSKRPAVVARLPRPEQDLLERAGNPY